jgi:hypothetical protein
MEKSLAVSGEASDSNGISFTVCAFDSEIAVDIVLIVTFTHLFTLSFFFLLWFGVISPFGSAQKYI